MQQRGEAVRRRRAAVATGLVLVAGLAVGCSSSPPDTRSGASSSAAPTPVADLDLTGVVPTRAPFCDRLDKSSVADVLGGAVERRTSYRSGQRAEVAVGVDDVANEYSCAFERGSGAELRTARTWLFAQAVTRGQAHAWITERKADDSCHAAGELAFGEPGLVQSCSSDTRRRVTAVGLFGDAWLTCQATAPRSFAGDELLEAAERWCADVALRAGS